VETLLLIAAEPREFAGLRRHCRDIQRLSWPLRYARSARLRSLRLLLAAHGAGPRLAAEACEVAWNRTRPQALASVGFCGALIPELPPAGIVVATEVIEPDAARTHSASAPRCSLPHRRGPVISIDSVAQTAQEKSRLAALGALAVEMEAAAVAERARLWGVPFFCIKSITDLAGESFKLDLNAARNDRGRLSDARILRAALRKPAVGVPEIVRLYRRSRMAANALGDFLAACEF
jgi:adenosylhomocysteine nucleosidase